MTLSDACSGFPLLGKKRKAAHLVIPWADRNMLFHQWFPIEKEGISGAKHVNQPQDSHDKTKEGMPFSR